MSQRNINYTRNDLLNDLCTINEEYVEDDFNRDSKYCKEVISYLLNPVFDKTDKSVEYYKQELSSNKNFGYTWSYLRKQTESFIEYLYIIECFIDSLIIDINKFYKEIRTTKNIELIFNNFILVTKNLQNSKIKSELIPENFHYINNIKNGYSITAKLDKITLFTINRKNEEDISQLIDGVDLIVENK